TCPLLQLYTCYSTLPPPPTPPLFPYTTLFRSATGGRQLTSVGAAFAADRELAEPERFSTEPADATGESGVDAWLVRPAGFAPDRSEEHTSELQSLTNLVCRLLLEKKKQLTHHT